MRARTRADLGLGVDDEEKSYYKTTKGVTAAPLSYLIYHVRIRMPVPQHYETKSR